MPWVERQTDPYPARDITTPNSPASYNRLVLLVGVCKSSLLQLILEELSKTDITPKRTRGERCRQFTLRFGACTVVQALWEGVRTPPPQVPIIADEEDSCIDSTLGTTKEPRVTCIFASFDAWLFADSDVLWAVLISEIFQQVRVL